jgi:iron complex transport system permease protein
MTRKPLTLRRSAAVLSLLVLLTAAIVVVSVCIGSVSLPPGTVLRALFAGGPVGDAERTIIIDIRLPRVLLGFIVGGGLSVAGLALQALLRNPLAEPYVLGISSGGTVGAVAAMTLAGGAFALSVPIASFAGSACVMVLVYWLAQRRGKLDPYTLLLSGIMIGAFFNAAVLLYVAIANQDIRPAFLWLMGNLSGADTEKLIIVGPVVVVLSGVLTGQAKKLNLVSTGEESALQLGVNLARTRMLSYLLSSVLTGFVVSVSGVVGFVGLLIPHVCRMVLGPDHRLLFPASFLVGGSFLIVTDLLSRTLLSPSEIPVGAVTAAIGAPIFVYLLKRT